jgi:hypothetical protein
MIKKTLKVNGVTRTVIAGLTSRWPMFFANSWD